MKFREPFQVNVFVVSLEGGTPLYLMLRRSEAHGGFWQGVTGGVEKNEPFLEAARRELFEETGIEAKLIHSLGYTYFFPLARKDWTASFKKNVTEIREEVFWTEVEGLPEPRLSEEHVAFRWANLETALSLLKWPNNKEALKILDEKLNRRTE